MLKTFASGRRRVRPSKKEGADFGLVKDFTRIIVLLRKERGITQKQAARDLGVSQALLSHYEKGIRACGLDFVVRLADYYHVSCDYLLGRSADRTGVTLTAEELPEPDASRDGHYRGSVLPTLNKKLLFNSMNILFDKLNACPDKHLVGEISGYLMLAVYKMYRLLYSAYPKNNDNNFAVDRRSYRGYASAAMQLAETRVERLLAQETLAGHNLRELEQLSMTGEKLAHDYPQYASSLANLVRNSEERMRALEAADGQ